MAKDINVVELFAGVGGFRIGLEGASDYYKTLFFNQWEPSTQHQDAYIVYKSRFGNSPCAAKFNNTDINEVKTTDIPDHDLLVGGFPCQDYSVASTLSRSGGIEGKKGVLWWQIHRIIQEKGDKSPNYLFFENVDRIINSPAKQRGRDFGIILATLSDLGYIVEWRVINAAEYGFPQRRRRTYIVGYKKGSAIANKVEDAKDWMLHNGVLANAFPMAEKAKTFSDFTIDGDIKNVSDNFGGKTTPFCDAGIMIDRHVYSVDYEPNYDGPRQLLGNILLAEDFIPEEFYISEDELPRWQYEKGAKKIHRTSKEGHEYDFSEGPMAFPDFLDRPSRTIITGEGGASASRFKHVVLTENGRYRRLVPIELERLNMFPDNHTYHAEVSDGRRAFLMGNALVCGVVREVGRQLFRFMFDEAPVSTHPIDDVRENQPKAELSLFNHLVEKPIYNKPTKTFTPKLDKNVLIGLVREDNAEYFLDGGQTKLYYTGKLAERKFPSTIALNKLYYFMPYIKGKGVKDLYLIRVARLGNKAEIHSETGDQSPRLVFELDLLTSLPEYKNIQPNILHTYRDTVLGSIL